MRLETDNQGGIVASEMDVPITFVTKSGEQITIITQEKGFEITYASDLLRFRNGEVTRHLAIKEDD